MSEFPRTQSLCLLGSGSLANRGYLMSGEFALGIVGFFSFLKLCSGCFEQMGTNGLNCKYGEKSKDALGGGKVFQSVETGAPAATKK